MGARARAPGAPIALAALLAGCGDPQWPAPNAATWPTYVALLDQLRDQVRPASPWAATLGFRAFDSHSGRTIEGRGALAVAPGSAARLVLVGPAGATVLDAWITREQWRVAVPQAHMVERGGTRSPTDLPVGFLHWWFVAPLSGTLVAATFTKTGLAWLLHDGPAHVELRKWFCDDKRMLLEATRRQPGKKERATECRTEGAAITVGDRASYDDLTNGLHVDVEVQAVAATPPDPDAFRDPETPIASAPGAGEEP
jgi:hypothetical protein